ncbi:MAG: response regulator [Archangium sp.]|nr:response regulator [Archangium sp.]
MNARLLIVEDNADFVANLREILEDLGHQVRTASSCEAALERARGWVQVALVDLRLPDGDGTLLAERLKELEPDCEVVLLTGHASVESAAAAVRAGVWDYLIKPCATPDLLATVSKALRHVQSQSEKRELARRAQRAEKLAMVGTLTAGLSHEIRNPLNAAGLQLTVLERRVRKLEASLQQPLLEPLTLVRDEIRRLEHILRDFLQFARPAPLTLNPVSVSELLSRVTALMSQEAEKRGVTLSCEATDTGAVPGDGDQLRQVFMNLTLNALDAAGPGGRVAISTTVSSEWLHVCVDDSGKGVDPSMRDRLFEPFFTTKAQGSGLGLPISHGIVSQHGGRIELGRAPLGGARFEVVLPRR